MSFNAIRENKILAKNSEFTVDAQVPSQHDPIVSSSGIIILIIGVGKGLTSSLSCM